MNTTETLYLPVDGIFEMFDSVARHRQSRVTRPVLHATGFSPVLQHPGVSNIPKAGFGIIKTVKGRWRQQDRRAVLSRSSSSGNRHLPNDLLPRRSVDLLEMGLAKPGNCHRIVVLGAPKAGKTNILRRFLGRDFDERYEPTTEDFHRKLFHIRGEAYQVDVLDAAGERDFPAKRRLSILTGEHRGRCFGQHHLGQEIMSHQVHMHSFHNGTRALSPQGTSSYSSLVWTTEPPSVRLVGCWTKSQLPGQS